MKHIKTQKIYTFPDREFYGEYCLLSLAELRVKIAKGEIKEQLCYIDNDGVAYIFDENGKPDGYSDDYIESQHLTMLRRLLSEQFKNNGIPRT